MENLSHTRAKVVNKTHYRKFQARIQQAKITKKEEWNKEKEYFLLCVTYVSKKNMKILTPKAIHFRRKTAKRETNNNNWWAKSLIAAWMKVYKYQMIKLKNQEAKVSQSKKRILVVSKNLFNYNKKTC